MTEAKLLELLAQVRQNDLATEYQNPFDHPGALTFSRAQQLVLDPSSWKETEREHVRVCRSCARRLQIFSEVIVEEKSHDGSTNGILAFPGPISLPKPTAAAADTAEPLDVEAVVPDKNLEWRLVQDGSDVVLRLRTKDPVWQQQRLRYELHGAEGSVGVKGEMILRPDVTGWYAAVATFSLDQLYDALGGECRQIRFHPMNAE